MSNKPAYPNCSTSLHSQQIVGGQESVDFWPWQVLLTNAGQKVCGGSLISRKLILTAAHCLKGIFGYSNPKAYMRVRSVKGRNKFPNGWSSRLQHPGSVYFNRLTHDNDIAVIRMNKPAPEGTTPICLPEATEELNVGEGCYVAGYGKTNDWKLDKKLPLMEICLPILPDQICVERYAGHLNITKNMLCAGSEEKGKDTCVGDSGGALMCKRGDIWKVFGLVSVGSVKCGIGFPVIFTNVRNYVDELEKKLAEKNPSGWTPFH